MPLKRTGFKQKPRKPLKRTKLRVVGVSTVAQLKKEIQSLVREIVMIRDKGCVLRSKRHCGGDLDTTGVVIQADHLITRANSATFADTRLIVCVCRGCHMWKKYNANMYDALIRDVISKERIKLWERCEESRYTYKSAGAYDWKLSIVALEKELAELKK